MPFHHFKKGSAEAREYMARLRAMRGKKKKNPLTRSEAAHQITQARYTLTNARKYKGLRSELAGEAVGRMAAVEAHGPAAAREAALKMARRAIKVSIGMKTHGRKGNPLTLDEYKSILKQSSQAAADGARMRRSRREDLANYYQGRADAYYGTASTHYRHQNPPLLILNNPGRKRRKVIRAPRHSSYGECPKGFPMKVWRDPAFQAEIRVFRKRHGAHVPIHIAKVKMPPGSPKYMTAFGRAQHAVYDAPKASRRGKFIHHFGKKGKNKPWLVSSAAKGPKWLGYAGGTFQARTKWLYH